jgi:hypothetical protein
MSDAERFQEALQLLAAAVRHVLEDRNGTLEFTGKLDALQEAYDRYHNIVVELHGTQTEGVNDEDF